MEDVFTFAKEYYEDGGMAWERFLPKIRIKLRDELCLPGRKVQYDDFSKFVKRGSSYTPLVCTQLKKDDIVIDFAPLLSIGVAEVVAMLSHEDDYVDLHFLGWLQELEFADNWYSMLGTMGDMFDKSVDTSEELAFAESLRTSLIDYRWPVVKRMYATMQAIKIINPKSYCIAVIEGLKLAFSVASLWMAPKAKYLDEDRRQKMNESRFRWGQLTKERLGRFGALEYTIEGTSRKRKISDGRGLGISALCLFLIDFFNKFQSEPAKSKMVPYSVKSSRENIMSMFEACLGDDYVGRYLKKGTCYIADCDDSFICMGNEGNLIATDCHVKEQIDGINVGRGFYEASLLWKHAVGVKDAEPVGILPPVDVTYGTRIDFVHTSLEFAFSNRGMSMSQKLSDIYKGELLDAVLERVDTDGTIERYRQNLEQQANQAIMDARKDAVLLQDALSKAHNKLEAASLILAEKQNNIKELQAEVQSLRAKVRSTYSYEESDDLEEVLESPISPQEMLDFVNQFRIVVIGGIDTLKSRLEQAGFTNLYFANSMNTTGVVGDFFCVCTRFVSHKLVYNFEANYREQADSFFYFNSTNADVFLRTCYDFIKSWFDAGEEG